MLKQSYLKQLKYIKALVFDVDGVFTDNSLLASDSGELLRTFNAKDGFALKTAIENGLEVCIITGGASMAVYKRFEILGVKHNYYRISDKLKVLNTFLKEVNISPEHTLYIGDDIPDYEAMQICGIKCCPKDAVNEIKSIADYVCVQKGGDACVREVIEMVLKSQQKWFVNKK